MCRRLAVAHMSWCCGDREENQSFSISNFQLFPCFSCEDYLFDIRSSLTKKHNLLQQHGRATQTAIVWDSSGDNHCSYLSHSPVAFIFFDAATTTGTIPDTRKRTPRRETNPRPGRAASFLSSGLGPNGAAASKRGDGEQHVDVELLE